MLRIVAKVVLVHEGKMLIMRRGMTDKRRPGQWDLPGGAVDEGEDINSAAARETQEEAGITVDPLKLNLVYTEKAMTEVGFTMWLFFAEKVADSAVTISHEHSEYQWVTPEQALGMIEYPLHKALLKHLLDNHILEELQLLPQLQEA